MGLQIFGKIHKKYDTQKVSENFSKREFVVKTDEQYPQHILVELHQDNTDLLDNYEVGQNVTVSINLRGRSWTNPTDQKEKYFNTIIAWRIERSQADINTPTPAPEPTPVQANAFPNDDDEPDDLPF
jgi:hypothetical protein